MAAAAPPPSPAHSLSYRPEIDGLRALAVLPVIGYHAGFAGFAGGFVGVDVFFVISGYLITRILAGEMATGTYSLLRFYERRARRILPALAVVLLVSTAIAWAVLPPLEMQWYGQSVLATALFASNFYFMFRADNYFGGLTGEFPLLHTWSLAVEEQFYIFFPLLLWALWRLGCGRVLAVIAGLSVLSLIGAEILSRVDPGMNFYLLPTRVWELGAGALCALIHHHQGVRARAWPALAGLALIVASVVALPHGVRFPSLWAVPPVLGTVLVVLYAGAGNLTGRVLSWWPLVAVGLASYSAYLWHQPLFAFARIAGDGDPDLPAMLGLSALSVGLGFATLHLVERPFRRKGGAGHWGGAGNWGRARRILGGGRRAAGVLSARAVVAWSGVVLGGLAGLGLALYLSLGAAGRTAAAHLPKDYFRAVAAPIFPVIGNDLRWCGNFCRVVRGTASGAAAASGHGADAARAGPWRVLLAGDSHAQDMIPAMTALARVQGWELVLYIDKGCSFTRMTPGCAVSAARLAGASGFDQVVLVNRFSAMPAMRASRTPDALAEGAMADYAALVAALRSEGAAVTVLAPRPVLTTDPVRAALADRIGTIGIADDFALSPPWRGAAREMAAGDGVQIVDQRGVLLGLDCGAAACFHAHDANRLPLYRDNHHLSPFAARQMVDQVAPHIQPAPRA